MPNRPATNRPEIVKKIAKDLKITQNQTEEIVLSFEHQIMRFLREREQVRLVGLGRLVVVTRKSRTIRQVNTRIPRLLLESRTILFRINPNFKDVLHGRPPKLRIENRVLSIESAPLASQPVSIQPSVSHPLAQTLHPAPSDLRPSSTMSEERKQQIKESINQRILGLKGETPAPVKPEDSPDVRVVVALLRQIKHLGYDSIAFTYSNNEIIEIFCGKPQKQVSHLPKNIVKRFLEAIELHDLHIPQVRNLALALNKEKYDKIFLELHSMPTVMGASVKITIK
jgi:nucleoid DNA-binding protein